MPDQTNIVDRIQAAAIPAGRSVALADEKNGRGRTFDTGRGFPGWCVSRGIDIFCSSTRYLMQRETMREHFSECLSKELPGVSPTDL